MTTAFADPKSLTHEELEEGTAFAPRFDDKGLITVVTVEAGSKDVLMVAHMNAEALALTLRLASPTTGRGREIRSGRRAKPRASCRKWWS